MDLRDLEVRTLARAKANKDDFQKAEKVWWVDPA
jgi:hypothetical protein